MIVFDMRKLKGRIIEICGNLGNFMKSMGWSGTTNGRKVSGERLWDQAEILKACNILSIQPDEVWTYFFTERVKD